MRTTTLVAVLTLAACIAGRHSIGANIMSSSENIPPTNPIPTGLAPGMRVKLLKDTPEEKVYAIIFAKGDEAMSGLTDFAMKYGVTDAHFTGIGASSGGKLGWLDLPHKVYRAIPVNEQVEVLSLIGDVASFNGKPAVHAHLVLGKPDGSTIGGHLWELHVNPTLEVFVTVNATQLNKSPDDTSGLKLIDPSK
jgi:hypothetical protein